MKRKREKPLDLNSLPAKTKALLQSLSKDLGLEEAKVAQMALMLSQLYRKQG